MSYFSILEPRPAEDGSFEVMRCHVNVWSLPGLLGHRPMLLDVGVMFDRARQLKAMHMVVPAHVARLIDLSAETGRSDVGRLLFGRTFVSASPGCLVLNDVGKVAIVSVDKRLEIKERDRELTAVRLELGSMPATGPCYLRVRFALDDGGVMWRWQRALGRRNGVLIDFRSPDPRDGGRERRRALLDGRDKPIPELDCFFMLPERFQLHSSNPELKYTRTLEGDRWRPYLRRRVGGAFRRERIMVHRWHRDEVHPQHPFRGFLQFNREPGFLARSDYLISALALAVVSFAAFRPFELRAAPADTTAWIGSRLADVVALGIKVAIAAGVIGVASFVIALLLRLRKLPGVLTRIKRRLKRMEYWWMRTFGR